jgi:hypothetical protein
MYIDAHPKFISPPVCNSLMHMVHPCKAREPRILYNKRHDTSPRTTGPKPRHVSKKAQRPRPLISEKGIPQQSFLSSFFYVQHRATRQLPQFRRISLRPRSIKGARAFSGVVSSQNGWPRHRRHRSLPPLPPWTPWCSARCLPRQSHRPSMPEVLAEAGEVGRQLSPKD